ncbi:hypothetical protein ACKVEX_00160 [Rhodocyclaceae bacterium SMB388]
MDKQQRKFVSMRSRSGSPRNIFSTFRDFAARTGIGDFPSARIAEYRNGCIKVLSINDFSAFGAALPAPERNKMLRRSMPCRKIFSPSRELPE